MWPCDRGHSKFSSCRFCANQHRHKKTAPKMKIPSERALLCFLSQKRQWMFFLAASQEDGSKNEKKYLKKKSLAPSLGLEVNLNALWKWFMTVTSGGRVWVRRLWPHWVLYQITRDSRDRDHDHCDRDRVPWLCHSVVSLWARFTLRRRIVRALTVTVTVTHGHGHGHG
jgi:hypothetical protein